MSLDLLNSMSPETGRIIKEDGTVINMADAFYLDGSDVKLRTSGGGGSGASSYESMRLSALSLEASGFVPFLAEEALADNLTTNGGELSTVASATATFDTDGYTTDAPTGLELFYDFDGETGLENKLSDGVEAVSGTNTTTIVTTTPTSARGDDWVYNRTREEYTQVTAGTGTDTLTVSPAVTGQTTGDIIGLTDMYTGELQPGLGTVFNFPALDVNADFSGITFIDPTELFPSGVLNIGAAFSPDNVTTTQLIFTTTGEEAIIGYITTSGTFAVSTLNEELQPGTPIVESSALTIGEDYLVLVKYDGSSNISLWVNGSEVDTATGVTLDPTTANEIYWGGVDLGEGISFGLIGRLGNIGIFSSNPPDASTLTAIWNDGTPYNWVYNASTVTITIEDSTTFQRVIPTTVSSVSFTPVYSGDINDIQAVIKDNLGNEIVAVANEAITNIPTADQGDVKGGDLEITIISDFDETKLHGYYLLCNE